MKARLALALLLVACSDPEPRYGETTLSNAAPRLELTGTTFGGAAALELAPGCAGFLDPEHPAHVVHVADGPGMTVRARSERGPLALAVARGDEVRCDNDHGSGHAPTLTFEGPGDYAVYVASLRAPAALPYTLDVSTRRTERAPARTVPSQPRDVSVTITSAPSGATVRDADGRVVGTTPAMFVVHVAPNDAHAQRSWVLDLAGHRNTTVSGRLDAEELVFHSELPAETPTRVERTASGPRPITDFRTASLAIDVPDECTISQGEVEVAIRHTFIADLRIVLHTPWGTDLTLHRHEGGDRHNLQRTWSTSSRTLGSLLGHSTRGRWNLVVHDEADEDRGSLERFGLRFACGTGAIASNTPPTPPEQPPAHDPTPRPNPPSAQPQPRLPELPNHSDIVAVLARMRPSIERRCAHGGGSVRLYFTLNGSGTVSDASASGSASPAEQSCVARAVRGGRFPRFRRQSIDVDYTYDLPAQAATPPSIQPINQPAPI